MARSSKLLPELRQMLAQCLLEVPGCGDCELRAVCVHRPDHTGCNWSAEVDFLRAARRRRCATCRGPAA